jgi:hypothetical protein
MPFPLAPLGFPYMGANLHDTVLLFQSQFGLMLGKLRLRWTGPYWIVNEESGMYPLGTLSDEVLPQWANGFRLKPYYGKLPPNPFLPTNGSGMTSEDVPAANKE